MVDLALARRGPLDGIDLASPADPHAAIVPLPERARFIVRGRDRLPAAAAAVLGFPLPVEVCRAASAGDAAALWLGPDEWLVIGPDVAHKALARDLADALSGVPHALVDVSHRSSGVVLSGPKAAFVLNHGCPLDLGLGACPVGMCTRTLVGRTEAILWRTGETEFQVKVWRSFVAYLVDFLREARREFE
ncbi:MAG TPA: sarcosine oxidase subunit gamma family protein [Methylomirabilota bacterium]|nr:sarcosine oxidase subunit gamma family protein [Methylomirabilota bacterium]